MKKNLLFTMLFVMSISVFGQKLPFQGKLIESGTPVEGTRTFVFEIAAVNWSETHADVTITDGLYFVVLGSINPLPDSLFYGVSEQSMSISVDGTALSPVTLFKPLSSPFEGSDLTVKNDEGTTVGKFFAQEDLKNGELLLNGPNGNANVTIGSTDVNGNEGEIDISNTNGDKKVRIRLFEDTGNLAFDGKTTGNISAGFKFWQGEAGADMPFFWLTNSTRRMITMDVQNQSGLGETGFLEISGPNSTNFIFDNRHWENPDLPRLLLKGSSNQNVLQLSAENDENESGTISLWSKNGKSTYLRAGGVDYWGPNSKNLDMGSKSWENEDFGFINMWGSNDFHAMEISVTEDDNGNQFGYINMMSQNGKSLYLSPESFGVDKFSMNTANQNGGSSGEMFIYGNTTPNIQIGSQPWNNHDLGFFQVFTDKPNGDGWYYGAALIMANTDGTNSWGSMNLNNNGEQTIGLDGLNGTIDLKSQNGKTLHLSPESFGLDKISLNTVNQNGGSSGEMTLWGENGTPNIQMGGKPWENHDLGSFTVFTDKPDGNGWYYGAASINANTNGTDSWGRISLNNNGEERVLINGENGDITLSGPNSGRMDVRGPNSQNIKLGSREWENADLPQISLHGENDFQTMELSAYSDGNGYQEGFLNVKANTGRSTQVGPNILALHNQNNQQTVALETFDNGQGEFGSFRLNGPNTTNFEFNPGWWDQSDRAIFNMNGETDENRLTFIVENNDYGVEAGKILTYTADEKLSITEATRTGLVDVSGGGWNPLAMMSINNDSGNGWAGNINVRGPGSNNITIGSKNWENADLPWLALEGTHGNNLLHLTAIGGDNEFGYLHLNADDGSKSNINAFRIENRSADDQQVGYFDPYRVTFNDNGQEMTYNAWGISGSSPLEIQNGANVTGTLNVNGDITGSGNFGYSDRRLKTNIQLLDKNVLQKVELLKGVSYNWRQDEFPEKNFSSDRQIGVIAQELEAQFPELVKTNADGYKSVNYNGFTAVLLEAVKELNAKVEKLETENTQLKAELSASAANKNEIEQLKAQMESLVKMIQGQRSTVLEENHSVTGLK